VGEVKVAAATAIINTLKQPREADRGLLTRLHDSRSPCEPHRSFAAPIVPVFRATRRGEPRFSKSIQSILPRVSLSSNTSEQCNRNCIGLPNSHAPFL